MVPEREQKHRWQLLIRQFIRNYAVEVIVRLFILIPVRTFRNMDGAATVMMQESMMDFIIRLKRLSVFMATVSGREESLLIMKRVITYGTFDLLHYGHINLLRRARQLGDYLIVGLSTDEFNWNEKQKKCYFSYEKRKQLLEAIRYVDLVIPEENWEQKRSDVKEYHVDTFVMGDDWKGKFDFLKEEGCEVVYLPRTPEISSSQIKEDLHTKEQQK